MHIRRFLILFIFTLFLSVSTDAHDVNDASVSFIPAAIESGKVTIQQSGEYRIIKSNGLPKHTTGQFPHRNNPNAIQT